MKIIFLGPPGSGKGTYASRIAPKLGLPYIGTGDIARQAITEKTPEGMEADKYYSAGLPVPDEIITKIIISRISQSNCKDGFVLDTPYNVEQAKEIDEKIGTDAAVNLIISENIIIQRLSTRRVCKDCGEIYNIRTVKPKVEGKCDKCGGDLYQRKDDSPEAIKERLRVYEERAGPLIDYYKEREILINVGCTEADAPPEVMVEKIIELLRV